MPGPRNLTTPRRLFAPAFGLTAILLAVTAVHPCRGASTKEPGEWLPTRPAEKTESAPPASTQEVTVLSDLDGGIMRPVLDFISESTGVKTRLLAYPRDGSTGEPELGYDLFMGCSVQPRRFHLRSFSPEAWEKLPGRSSGGVFLWSWWRSGLVLNAVLAGSEHDPGPGGDTGGSGSSMEMLVGAVTAIHPRHDLLTAAALYTLYREYGGEVLEYVHGLVPYYATSRTEVVAWVESGRYAGAYTVDAFFKPSLSLGYPLRFEYTALDSGEYPRTAVVGENVAFISARAGNPEGAELVAAFLASPSFQELIQNYFSTTPPAAPSESLRLKVEEGWLPRLLEAWGRLPFSDWRD